MSYDIHLIVCMFAFPLQETPLKKIRLTRALRSAIYQAAKQRVHGASPRFEIGMRKMEGELSDTGNFRLWEKEADLLYTEPLSAKLLLQLDDTGLCELDLYAYSGHKEHRELETNVYVLHNATEVIAVASVGDRHRVEWDTKYPRVGTKGTLA